MESTYSDGSKPDDDEICGLLLATLFAGQAPSIVFQQFLDSFANC